MVPDLEFGDWYFRVTVFAFAGGQGAANDVIATVADVSAPAAVTNLQTSIEY